MDGLCLRILALCVTSLWVAAAPAAEAEAGKGNCDGSLPEVKAPPEALRADPFYRKYVSAGGLPILGSEKVSDRALQEAACIIDRMLGARDDLRKALIDAGVRIVVMHPTEMTTDVPEQRDMKPKAYWDRRARGLGGRITSCGEENLLNLPGDRYPTENILVHEFGHTIHGFALPRVDPGFDARLGKLYDDAKAAGRWKGTYAIGNPSEYWAEGVQSWFDTNRQNDWQHNHVNTREELKEYDPGLAALIAGVLGDRPWRYRRYDGRSLDTDRVLFFKRFEIDREDGDGPPRFIRAADLDGDGDIDFAASEAESVVVHENVGDAKGPRWEKRDVSGPCLACFDLQIVDVNADGKPDIIGIGKGRAIVTLFENASVGGRPPQ